MDQARAVEPGQAQVVRKDLEIKILLSVCTYAALLVWVHNKTS